MPDRSAILPRLMTLEQAKAYLSGEHPNRFGILPVSYGRAHKYDRRAIDAALDRLSGLASQSSGEANDNGEDELEDLREALDAARRT